MWIMQVEAQDQQENKKMICYQSEPTLIYFYNSDMGIIKQHCHMNRVIEWDVDVQMKPNIFYKYSTNQHNVTW